MLESAPRRCAIVAFDVDRSARRANQCAGSVLAVQSHLQKYFCFRLTQINFRTLTVSPTEGRIAIVTDAGWDAVDADGAKDESADFADGEVVWS